MQTNIKTIKQITLTASLMALIIITKVIFSYVPGIFIPFLKLELVDLFILISLLFLGPIYSYLLAIVSPWILLLLSKDGGPIGAFALMLSSIGFLSLFITFRFIFNKILVNIKDIKRKTVVVSLIASVFSIILNSLFMTFCNYLFILDLYNASIYKEKIWVAFLPFNIIKSSINSIIYLIISIILWPFYQNYDKKTD